MIYNGPGKFACKDKDVRRDRPQITMTINAEGHGTNCVGAALVAALLPRLGRPQGAPLQMSAIRIAPAASSKKPGAVSRPGTLREFQFHE
jgi:hypothetical protein